MIPAAHFLPRGLLPVTKKARLYEKRANFLALFQKQSLFYDS